MLWMRNCAAGLLAVLLLAPGAGASTDPPLLLQPYTVACDARCLPQGCAAAYLHSVREAVRAWNRTAGADGPLFVWGDIAQAEILVQFVPSLEDACGQIHMVRKGAPGRFAIRLSAMEPNGVVPHHPLSIQHVAAHELGHALGLKDEQDPARVMGPDLHWPDSLPGTTLPERRSWWPPVRPDYGGPEQADRALPYLAEFRDHSPDIAVLTLVWQADDLYRSGQTASALQWYQRAVEAAPSWTGARLRRAQAAYLSKGVARLLILAQADLSALPDSPTVATTAVDAFRLNRRPAEGIRLGRSLMPRFGGEPIFLRAYGECLWRAGRGDAARAVWQRALSLPCNPRVRAQICWSCADSHGGDPAALRRALPYLQQALAATDGGSACFHSHSKLGLALWRLGRHGEALPHLEAALQWWPRSTVAGIAAAECCLRLGRFEEAQRWLDRHAPFCRDPAWKARARRLQLDLAVQQASRRALHLFGVTMAALMLAGLGTGAQRRWRLPGARFLPGREGGR
jgi:tetratricopeptide (TPR) repeat protein